MRFFVIGGSGYIGSVVYEHLLSRDHQVLGLARSDESADELAAAGIEPVRGALLGWRPSQPGVVADLRSLPTPLDAAMVYPGRRQSALRPSA